MEKLIHKIKQMFCVHSWVNIYTYNITGDFRCIKCGKRKKFLIFKKMEKRKNFQELLDEMDKDPWYVKFKRWVRLKVWTYKCLSRKFWDKEYERYIFKKKQI